MPSKPRPSREDIYRILDQVLETGIPVEIERGGKLLKIIPVEPRSKLENLKPRKYLLSDPEELVNLDWSGEWRP
ncbi:MAG: type II toxin-antitoxin system Phd/YefM family antitoxin [Thermoanaerobaculia bacterium]